MCKRLLTTVAVPLFAAIAYAQQYPTSTSGYPTDGSSSQWNQQNPQNQQVNCSDPIQSYSPQCSGSLDSANPGAQNTRLPSGTDILNNQSGRVTTYTDDRNATNINSRVRSTTVPLPPEPLTEFQRFTAATTGMVLPVFGADLFRSVPSTFAPLDNAPVPPDYVLGPDDQLHVRVWGQVSFDADVRVDRAGDIFLQQVGTVHLAGVRFSDLEQHLRDSIGKIYRNFQLTADLGEIRAIQIYVTGEARRPGVYTVSSLTTLVDALFASGGPSVQGSMRHIELKRGGSTLSTFDLYKFILSGDKSNDAKLLPGDLIYIPSVGPQAAVLGSVRRPAVYELLPGETIADALKDAGNISSLASDTRASLERNAEHAGRLAMEVRLDTAGMATTLADGDILHVLSLATRFQKTITLRGNTANPGRFAWHQGMRLSDLIPDRESLITRDYWWKRVGLGLPAPEFEPLPALSALRQPANPIDLPLMQTQRRRQPARNDVTGDNRGNNNGAYNNSNNLPDNSRNQSNLPEDPSFYWDYPSGSTPSDNPPAAADSPGQNSQNGMQQPNNLNQRPPVMRGSQSALGEDDSETPEQINPRPSRRTEVRLSVPEIDWSYAVIERMDPDTLKTTLVPFDLGKLVLHHDTSQDLELQPGDMVSVFSQADIHVPIAEQTGLIRLQGEFAHAGTYSVRPGETLRSLVERAGGLSPNAYLYGSVFTRESTRIVQQRRMDEAIHEMALQMQRGNLALAASPGSTPQDLAGISAAQASGRELVSQLAQVRATGRIVFSFLADSRGTDSIPDIPLENGDIFLIPSVPSTVNAVGAVFNQNSFLYRPTAKLESYLQLAGGPRNSADRKQMFIVRANGAVVSRASVKGPWGNEFFHLKLNPGDTLVVPDKTIKPSALRGLLDWSQIVSQTMFGAVAASVVF